MTRFLRVLAGTLGIAAVGLTAVSFVIGSQNEAENFTEGVIWGTAAMLVALIGGVVAVRRPRHVVGWLLVIAGLGETLAGTSSLYGAHVTAAGGRLPFADGVGWVGGSLWAFSITSLLVFLPLYFPTGRPPSPRWRWVAWIGTAGIMLLLLSTIDIALFRSELMGLEWDAVEAQAAGRPLFALSELGFPVILAAAPLALLSLVVRFFRSRGVERQQIKLLVFAVALTVTFILLLNLTELPPLVEAVGTAVAMPSIGIATMIAVLRYRLFEIDRLVSRTLTYGLLTVLLAAIYLAGVTVLTAATAPFTRDSPVAVAAATLLAAAAFRPARRRIQAMVDRRFNRAAYSAEATVGMYRTRLRDELELDGISRNLEDVVASSLQPSALVLWLRAPEAGR